MELTGSALRECVERIKLAMQSLKQNIIEIGTWLSKAKAMLPHGEFSDWLNDNFNLSQKSAENYMRAAEVSSKIENVFDYQPSALIEMAKLPAAEVEKFTAEYPNAANLTVRQLRGAIKQWTKASTKIVATSKSTDFATTANSDLIDSLKAEITRLKSELAAANDTIAELREINDVQTALIDNLIIETVEVKEFASEVVDTAISQIEDNIISQIANSATERYDVPIGGFSVKRAALNPAYTALWKADIDKSLSRIFGRKNNAAAFVKTGTCDDIIPAYGKT